MSEGLCITGYNLHRMGREMSVLNLYLAVMLAACCAHPLHAYFLGEYQQCLLSIMHVENFCRIHRRIQAGIQDGSTLFQHSAQSFKGGRGGGFGTAQACPAVRSCR